MHSTIAATAYILKCVFRKVHLTKIYSIKTKPGIKLFLIEF